MIAGVQERISEIKGGYGEMRKQKEKKEVEEVTQGLKM